MRGSGGLGRKRMKCPECGKLQSLTWQKGVKRSRPKSFICSKCDFIGGMSKWKEPTYE